MKWHVGRRPNLLAPPWVVHGPDGSYVGAFPTWLAAMAETRIGERIERWLHSLAG